jgi:hypothetical protein
MLDTFRKSLERLELVIEAETFALQQHLPIDLSESNHKKSHGLLELRRAARVLNEESLEFVQADLHRLKDKVEKNLSILEIHLKAVHAVSAIISDAIREHESDGTYSRLISSRVD